ncbi:DUF4350 domain-containing protein [Agromyces lapidis]|uniref:DUF4350 domain-containing protein n=1 Tax=Agromyces lapidis TaxID=279574 RepID=A0ABV5SR56_9MICO|nr:DUF4350 domain-containing protein [Agromyces lapidis]
MTAAPPAAAVASAPADVTPAAAITPTFRAGVRRRRIWIWFAIVLVLGAIALLVLRGGAAGAGQRLGADNPAPFGAKALVEVLGSHGVEVETADDFDTALTAAKSGATVLVFDEFGLLDEQRLSRLAMFADRVVVVEPGFAALEALAPGIRLAGAASGALDEVACELPAAENAGALSTDQRLFTIDDEAASGGWQGCFRDGEYGYAVAEGPSSGDGRIALVGASTPFENGRITERGNAALAIGLAGASDELVWYLPGPLDADPDQAPTLGELTPGWVSPVLALAVVVTIVAGVWRGRRFGPLVVENLPVHVPAGETAVGRARLYARSAARRHALDQLRLGTLARIASALRLPRTADVAEIAAAAAAATRRDPGQVRAVLIDAVPTGDQEFVRLAAGLDDLEHAVRATLAPETSTPQPADHPGRRP